MGTLVAVAFGGAIGSLARHGVNMIAAHLFVRPVPYATAAVNLLGSAAIGVLAGLLSSGRIAMSPALRTFVFVGILGGFTTFSSLMLDTLTLMHTGERPLAAWNALGQMAAGFALVYVAYAIAVRLS